jgi:signal transduction histidine kinase
MRRLLSPLKILQQLRWPGGLSSRLLLLTAAFALVAEIMILLPSLAAYEEGWLLERERAAEEASLAVEAAPESMVTENLARQLLAGAGVNTVAVKIGGVRRLMLRAPQLGSTPALVDLRQARGAAWLWDPWEVMFGEPGRMIRVVAKPRFRTGDFVEIVLPSQPLKEDLIAFLIRTLAVSLIISVTAGGAVYLALSAFIVRPMRRITETIERFRADPEDPAVRPPLTNRRDEIGRTEQELGRMQDEVRQALRSRARLAALGEAVAKINHDLRNMLTSAQLQSERLAALGDPKVAKALPRLERALDRALSLAQNVLNYGRTEEAAPSTRRMLLRPAVEAAAEDAGLSDEGIRLEMDMGPRFLIEADPEQLHRILLNLMRNARQAIESEPHRNGKGVITVSAVKSDGQAMVRMADDGPGLPEKAIERLFQPFIGSARSGGAGLGLAISRELAQAHGGDVVLVRSGPEGAVFELRLPTGNRAQAPANDAA